VARRGPHLPVGGIAGGHAEVLPLGVGRDHALALRLRALRRSKDVPALQAACTRPRPRAAARGHAEFPRKHRALGWASLT